MPARTLRERDWLRVSISSQVPGCDTLLKKLHLNRPRICVDFARMAADRGHVQAQVSVGNLYGNGIGVLKDYAEALRWYRKAADQGNDEAQDNVARSTFSAGVCRKTTRKRCAGYARPPIRETMWLRETLPSYTCRVGAYRRTAPKRSAGFTKRPRRGMTNQKKP
jgi:Sel1 repeat